MLTGEGWITNADSHSHLHRDTGLFVISGASVSGNLLRLQDRIFEQFLRLVSIPISDVELLRAKNQLKSMIFMNLEQRSLLCEDMGRQVTIYDFKYSGQESSRQIDSITQKDIMTLVHKFLSTQPTIVAMGQKKELKCLPDYSTYQQYIADWRNRLG